MFGSTRNPARPDTGFAQWLRGNRTTQEPDMDHQEQQHEDGQEQQQAQELVELTALDLEQVVGGAVYSGNWD
jgi:hypothetical protein